MAPKVVWLLAFVGLYWVYCIFWGIKGALRAKTASDYFIAGRKLSIWVFVLAATATSFSGWTFMGHPGLVFRDGFQYAYASFYAITIPLTGVILLKRQWMLGKRYGYITPGEMLSDYFQGDAIRVLSVFVALFFSVPYMAIQLGASGYLFNVLSDNWISETAGMWILSIVVLIYVASGGLRAVAYVDTVQCILLALGMVITGGIALYALGGLDAFANNLALLGKNPDLGLWGSTCEGGVPHGGGCYNAYLAIPGVIQWTPGLGVGDNPVGGLWTGMMILTYLIGLMGIQSAPAFTMWAFGNNNPEPFAPQQVWASALMIGGIMIFFTAVQGMGAHFLGADPLVATEPIISEVVPVGREGYPLLPDDIAFKPDALVPYYFNLIAGDFPWLVGLLAICALAAMQSTGAAYLSTAGGILTRDLYKRYVNPTASHATQKFFGRISIAGIALAALGVATVTSDALVELGGHAVAFGLQMWPALLAICWFPWLTRQGVTWGLFVGLIAVFLTESPGVLWLDGILPWGRWPLTIHSAGWGIVLNVLVCVAVSAMTQNSQDRAHRMKYHTFLSEHAAIPKDKRRLIPVAWVLTLAWFFFAIGPGAVMGNTIFGAPDEGVEGWLFGIPSIWAWQILFWVLGVAMLWFLAYRMELSTVPRKEVEALVDDIGDTEQPMVPFR